MTAAAVHINGPADDSDVMTSLPKLAFGIEIDILVSPKQENTPASKVFRSLLLQHKWTDYAEPRDYESYDVKRDRNREALQKAVAHMLRRDAKMEAVDGPSGWEKSGPYTVWAIGHEEISEPPGFWSMEIVSPVLSTEDDWPATVERLFAILTKYCHVQTSWECGFHVHVSPGKHIKYTDSQLKAICKGLTLFEVVTTAVLPGHRKHNQWALSNVVNGDLPREPDARRIMHEFRNIPTQSWGPVFQMLDTLSCDREGLDILQGGNKDVAWNFWNITLPLSNVTGTIEFRRPPGIVSAAGANHWAAFVPGLFSEALFTNWAAEEKHLINKYDHPSVQELHDFVTRGLERLGPCNKNALVKGWVKEDLSTLEPSKL